MKALIMTWDVDTDNDTWGLGWSLVVDFPPTFMLEIDSSVPSVYWTIGDAQFHGCYAQRGFCRKFQFIVYEQCRWIGTKLTEESILPRGLPEDSFDSFSCLWTCNNFDFLGC